ncbi:MAG: UvrD-helicase domain-containing protein [Eggerthellaceae bacterium]|nr:UvrD-helicase domain-containing protein [Eggerthellaceae bacterium]
MNLDALSLTEAQRASIEHVSGPLLLCAGAGSGKTFTLQQRIAYALSPESGPAVDGIERVMAITFTEKAASEIKSRVRAALRAEGMLDAALKVDGAWISTIHAMAGRILRAHALELGMDPAFAVLDDVAADALRHRAYQAALDAAERDGDTGPALLLAEYPPSSAERAVSAESLVMAVLERASTLAGGLDALDWGPVGARTPGAVARELAVAYAEVAELPLTEKQALAVEEAREALGAYLADPGEPDDDGWRGLLEVLAGLGKPRVSKSVAEGVTRLHQQLDKALLEANLGLGGLMAGRLMALARATEAEYVRLKERAGAVDMADQLRLALAALRDHPAIAEALRERFQLVMVDEFQDTNQLQIDLIERICRPGAANLCTVGDSQQSIYRFQGADVDVYLGHKRAMASPEVGALCLSLDRNFRSHGDVLAFVRRVCGRPGYFVEDFLDLQPGRDEGAVVARGRHYRGEGPRIAVQAVAYSPRGAGGAAARQVEAAGIARWFAELRDAGHRAGEMVLLMGSMNPAPAYADALRAEGFSCVMAGGSGFHATAEAALAGYLLRALAQPEDTEALYAVLAGELFCLGADDLMELATLFSEEQEAPDALPRRCSIGRKAFPRVPEAASPRLALALGVMQRAWWDVGRVRPSRLVRRVLAESGHLGRLAGQGADGEARAANLLKAAALVEDLEAGGRDMVGVARAWADHAGDKEKLGALVGEAGDAVTIMTAHGSKGLEFPLVAVVDCYDGKADAGRLQMLVADGRAQASLLPSASATGLDARPRGAQRYDALFEEERDALMPGAGSVAAVLGAPTPAFYRTAMGAAAADEAALERRRLFYVAATRASEALLVSCRVQRTKEGPKLQAVQQDVADALFEGEGFPAEDRLVDFGGSGPLSYRFADADALAAEAAAGEGSCGVESGEAGEAPAPDAPDAVLVTYPAPAAPPRLPRGQAGRPDDGLVSYSALAEAGGGAAPVPSSVPDGGGVPASRDAGDDQAPAPPRTADGERWPPHLAADPDEATDVGSAFHRLAQLDALAGPDAARAAVGSQARAHGVSDEGRLAAALARWLGSDVRARARRAPVLEPELPFAVPIDGGAVLHGELDLLAADAPWAAPGGAALVVDYKTGGWASETPDEVLAKHGLQAACYAYAVLTAGYDAVELAFVRVEQADAADPRQPQVAAYRYAAADLPALREAVLGALCAASSDDAS